MPADRSDLRVDPSVPAGLAAALDRAAGRLASALRGLDADAGRIEPWLGDPVSADAAARYAAHAADGPGAAIEQLRALHAELVRARDTLDASGRGYAVTEDAVARSWATR
ncbi:PE domain-containing protein [Pseudonocardia nantongensis]|uniref:PE domain-containing protein n=1 Tax=Pseudonocardia nantongensis TaxID=1181885 RepID=UPI00397CBC53